MKEKISRNEPCPCGSGKKYKRCCDGKGFEWVRDENGDLFREVPLNEEMQELIKEARESFIKRHGREPGPDDLVFDDLPPLEHIEHEMVQAMKRAGISPAKIYAFEKTGRLVTEDNMSFIPDNELAEWQAAVEEYDRIHRPE